MADDPNNPLPPDDQPEDDGGPGQEPTPDDPDSLRPAIPPPGAREPRDLRNGSSGPLDPADAVSAGEGEGKEGELRRLAIERDGHRYEIRYAPGEEPQVLDGLARLAQSGAGQLNWFDAAVLSHQLGQQLKRRLNRTRESA